MNANLRNFALWVIIVLLLLALFTLFQNPGQRTTAQDISFSQLLTEVDQGRVRDVVIQGPEIHGTFANGTSFQTYAPSDPGLVQKLYTKGVAITARPPSDNVPWFVSLLVSWLPFIALIGVWIFLSRQMQGAGGKALGFGKSRAKLLTEALEFSGIAQELDDLLQILLRLVDTGDVLKRDTAVRLCEQFRARLAEAERLAARALHLARQENPNTDQRNERQPRHEQRDEPRNVVGRWPRGDRDALRIKFLHQAGIVRRVGLEAGAVREGAVDVRTLDHDVTDAALVDFRQQLRERDVLRGGALPGILEKREQRQQQQDDDHPECEISEVSVHHPS